MELKQYKTYKDSGIEWLGEIPKHWKKSSLKWYSTIYSGGTPSKVEEDYWINGTIPWLNSGTVNQGDITKASNYITEEAFQNSSAKWIPNQSLIIALAGQGKTKGMVGQVQFETTCNQSLGVIVPNEKIINRFLYYWLKNNYQNIRNLGGGDKRDGLNLVMIGGIPIPVPSKEEQTQIANYLNHKTAQLDTLIGKKQQLINLLQEERTAMINQAVTKGLDPNAPMKDSGIEWLGEIPEHWEVKRLKHIVKSPLKYGANESAEQENKDAPRYIRITDFGFDGKLKENTFKSLPIEKAENFLLDEGDILFARSGATVGKTFMFNNYSGLACFAGYLIKATCDKNIMLPEFLYSFTNASGYDNWKDSIFQQATIQNIGANKYNQLKLGVPPVEEQVIIIKQIAKEENSIYELIEKFQKEIELLKEYKTTLISEVVTGKVDVREEVLAQ
ncbi:restriction endonuclease subunit S [Polaribacter sp. R2A056_3_33]|uniref:restriction endonuclease subunit S n=1 Tax=Polaribacter sp. R2A056_3_33 TaxID=2745563 RepID=UPI001C4E5AD0|nr:restriction endonuclease subunit S [Polaribacter sp. R2A056_3_33]QXP72121.1 restriction endonuclease subunit S [Polaribacter sp. R2A056_3_33]